MANTMTRIAVNFASRKSTNGSREIYGGGTSMDEHVWYKSYDEEVPHTLSPYPSNTLLDVFAQTVKQRPNSTFLYFKGRSLTYSEIDRQSEALAAGLIAKGVKKGDTVALVLPNCPQFIISQLAIWKVCAIPVPLNPLYTEDEIKHGLVQCSAQAAIVLTTVYNSIKSFQAHHTRLRLIIATNIKEYTPPMVNLAFTLQKEKKGGHKISLQKGDIWMQDLIAQNLGSSLPSIKVGPEDIALLLQSGGVTGIPRGIMIKHRAMMAEALQLKAWYGSNLSEWNDVVLVTLPLFHVYGNAAVMALAIAGHNPMALVPDPRDHNDVIHTIKKVKPAIFPTVPTLIVALLNHTAAKAKKDYFKCIKICISGAGPLMPETKRQFESLTGGKFVEGYGLTETTAAITVNPVHGLWKERSVGLPLPDVNLKIVDTDTGQQELPTGEIGEIVVKCPQVMQGFWNSLEETAEMLHDEWLYTGDIGYMDDEGYLFITSRKKDVIKVSGFQVWPREVASVISTHPAVAEVAIGSVPDPVQVEAVKAWVVLRKDSQCTVADLRVYCREKLTAYKVPRYIEFMDHLPKTSTEQVSIRTLIKDGKA
ncbi:MAG: long-chain-fatty-acid--CoA ligase [Dehalococcoidia bacterium]